MHHPQGESVLDLYDAVATQEVPYPRAQPISHELQDLFLRLLCKDPRRRCTAEEVRGRAAAWSRQRAEAGCTHV